ncbi:translocation/assembly module TamB domain-containing protein [Lunatimonas lonarensis]|nr:translocation/assembly module TamB domain-containing protein [Lunatimonas lonarensis]
MAKAIGWLIAIIVFLIVALLLVLRSPWGQDFIVQKVTAFLSEKTKTTVAIDRLFFTFRGDVYLEGFYVEDQRGDTLVYSKSLETGLRIRPLLTSGGIHVSRLNWDGFVASVSRNEQGTFNFDFLLDAFMSSDDDGKKKGSDQKDASVKDKGLFPDVSLGPVRFSDFLIRYDDEMVGMDVYLQVGLFDLDVNSLDLNAMEFDLGNIRLEDSDIKYFQRKPLPETEDSPTDLVEPALILERLVLNNIGLTYASVPDQTSADLRIGKFSLSVPELDMRSRQLTVSELSLKQSDIELVLLGEGTDSVAEESPAGEQVFFWPDWEVRVGMVDLHENKLVFRTSEISPQPGKFDPGALILDGFVFQASGISLANETLKASIDQIAFAERSGFRLDQFRVKTTLDDQGVVINGFHVETGNSKLSGDLNIGYDGFDALIGNLEWDRVGVDIPSFQLGLQDALFFSPDLRENAFFTPLAKRAVAGVMRFEGTPDDLKISDAKISWGRHTKVSLSGSLGNLTDFEHLRLDLSPVTVETNQANLNELLKAYELPVSFPEEMKLVAAIRGALPDLSVETDLNTTDGHVSVKANYMESDLPRYEADVYLAELDLGKIIQNPQLGLVSYRMQVEGSGLSLEEMQLALASKFEVLEYAEYDYSGLTLNAAFSTQRGNMQLAFADENLDIELSASAVLFDDKSTVDLTLDLRGADFRALNLSQEDLRLRINYGIHWEGNAGEFVLQTQLNEGLLIFDENSIPIENFDLTAEVNADTTSAYLASSVLQFEVHSNANPERTIGRMASYFEGLVSEGSDIAGDSSFFDFVFRIEVPRSRLLEEVIMPGLENWETLNGEVTLRQPEGGFEGSFILPNFTYGAISIDSLGLSALGSNDTFHFEAGLVSLHSGALGVGRTLFDGIWQTNQLSLDFLAYDGEEKLAHVGLDLGFDGDTVRLHINPEDLVLNKRDWEILPENLIRYAQGWIDIEAFELTRNDQRLLISNSIENVTEDHIGLIFRDFRLATFTSILNPDELIATGFVNGRFVLENPFGALGILADLTVDDLTVFSNSLGNLRLAAKSMGDGGYDFSMALRDGGITFGLFGDYQVAESGAELNLEMNLSELKLSLLEAFLEDQISGTTGKISGKARVYGTTAEPVYEGEFSFADAALTVNALNARYKINQQLFKVDNEGVYFDEFTIRDTDDNAFVFGGTIFTRNLDNPEFDLRLTASNFQVLNSSREDNDLFFGKAFIDVNASIQGDLALPRVNSRLNVRSGTDVTFIIPESQLDVIERDGVVLFINRQDPEDILTRRQIESVTSGITGFQVSALVEADPNATFRIVVDERSGDNLLIAGKANLNLNVDPNGRIDLSGIYELSTGHYEMSLYNLVSRRFEIEEGSTISWSGDPLDATLNVVAIYRVRTSAAELMAAQTAGLGPEARAQYKQELPFLVYLNIDGDLTRLEPSFRLDMPEEQRGAGGGNVYGQLQLLNSQEGELNRQVFSLLVLNRFFPDRGSDGAVGGASALARSSVSQLLSGQLNSLSENVLGDSSLELDFDLDSFTEYQSGGLQDRTQLNVSARSRFMDDRLIVQVGSQIDIEGSSQAMDGGNALLGNVSVEYLLTENGRYRLRGFRRNQFESFIDGQLIVTGISLIFNREFNHFEELWRGIETRRNTQPATRKEDDENDNSESNDQQP